MNETQWHASQEPWAMLDWIMSRPTPRPPATGPRPPSQRKMRLLAVAFRRAGGHDWSPPFYGAGHQVGSGYQVWEADEYEVPPDHSQPGEMIHAFCRQGVPGNAPPEVCAGVVRCVLGNPWRPFAVREVWRTQDVLSLAQAAFEERADRECEECNGRGGEEKYPYDDPTNKLMHGSYWYDCRRCAGSGRVTDGTLDPLRLAVLADALEEAGCPPLVPVTVQGQRASDPHQLLAHLRSAGPHYRGCAAVDAAWGRI